MEDRSTISPISGAPATAIEDSLAEPKITPEKPLRRVSEEKVEVLIKEVVRIKPGDFEAFKHAIEDFVAQWE